MFLCPKIIPGWIFLSKGSWFIYITSIQALKTRKIAYNNFLRFGWGPSPKIEIHGSLLLFSIFSSQGFLIRTASFLRSGADQKPLASEDVSPLMLYRNHRFCWWEMYSPIVNDKSSPPQLYIDYIHWCPSYLSWIEWIICHYIVVNPLL